MKLIARKPCSFGGQNFFIGQEIPESLVVDAGMQEKLGVISIVKGNYGAGASDGQSGALFTQEQVDAMISGAVEEAVKNATTELEQQAEMLQAATGLEALSSTVYDGKVIIAVEGDSDDENGQATAVPATPEEIKQVFSIMQMEAKEGAKVISEVESENVLILLHAADSRKAIKSAAKKQAEALFTDDDSNETDGSNATDSAEGADT